MWEGGGGAGLDLFPMLFVKLELYWWHFALLHSLKISFHKISVDLMLRLINLTPNLTRSARMDTNL